MSVIQSDAWNIDFRENSGVPLDTVALIFEW